MDGKWALSLDIPALSQTSPLTAERPWVCHAPGSLVLVYGNANATSLMRQKDTGVGSPVQLLLASGLSCWLTGQIFKLPSVRTEASGLSSSLNLPIPSSQPWSRLAPAFTKDKTPGTSGHPKFPRKESNLGSQKNSSTRRKGTRKIPRQVRRDLARALGHFACHTRCASLCTCSHAFPPRGRG